MWINFEENGKKCYYSNISKIILFDFYSRRIEVCMARVIRQHEEKISNLQSKAAEVTSSSMAAQDSFRKSFLMGLRDQLASDVSSRETLMKIIQSLTHERAIWGIKNQSR